MASIRCGNCKQTHTSVAEVYACYEKPSQPVAPEITEGFWVLGEDVYKVQRAVHGSGQLYAKRLMVGETPYGPDGDNLSAPTASFAYAPGAIRTLQNSARVEKLTLERAKELGHLYGVCMRCGRTLTDENSIEAGIGPVCAGKGF